ncbi:hypothetical protein P7K49_007941 [Saguinus oedipus]|uniref:Uncharacterized protein n=1 Tax=Saguinus oedipus TaxID=9490 RepID=A0ABQ9VWB4_SAGOE|nr:hypothetical protein P7K49_007941 [Saguinus oedipus]
MCLKTTDGKCHAAQVVNALARRRFPLNYYYQSFVCELRVLAAVTPSESLIRCGPSDHDWACTPPSKQAEVNIIYKDTPFKTWALCLRAPGYASRSVRDFLACCHHCCLYQRAGDTAKGGKAQKTA